MSNFINNNLSLGYMAIDTSFLRQLNRFNLVVRKRVTSSFTGGRKSMAAGRGLVIKDHRIYTPGDDFRTIDWRVFARTDKLHIKKYEEERDMQVHVIIDSSSSMHFGKPFTKYDYAAMLGVGYAYLATRNNEKFQYCTFDEDLRTFSSRRGMHQLAQMIDHFNNAEPEGISKLSDAVSKYKQFLKTRSLIVLISDFLIDLDEIKEALMKFGDHEITVIQVLDKSEIDLNLKGNLRLHDVETKGILKTFISRRTRYDYQDKLKNHIANVEKICSSLGIHYKLVSTEKPVFDTFYELLR